MKQFRCNAAREIEQLEEAVRMAFGITISCGYLSRHAVVRRFDSLEIGETLFDEDGDKWTRIA